MKKFLALSAILGLAGIGVGVARQQNQPTTRVVEAAAADTTTTSTSIAPAATTQTSPTTARKVTAKVAPKATTTTRAVAASLSPTTVTTAAPVTTTSVAGPTTTTTVAGPTPTCTATVDKPSISQTDTQTIRVASTMVATKTRIEIQYPKFGTGTPNPRQTYTPTTDAAGSVTQTFRPIDWSTVPAAVNVQFYGPAGNILGAPSCKTTFISTQA